MLNRMCTRKILKVSKPYLQYPNTYLPYVIRFTYLEPNKQLVYYYEQKELKYITTHSKHFYRDFKTREDALMYLKILRNGQCEICQNIMKCEDCHIHPRSLEPDN